MTDRSFTALIFSLIMVVATIILVDVLGSIQSENITAIALAVIAISAVFVSVWQGIENRKHNRLSVKPVINFDHVDDGVSMVNRGVGPAIITKLFLLGENKKYSWTSIKNVDEYIAQHSILAGLNVSQKNHLIACALSEQDRSSHRTLAFLRAEILFESRKNTHPTSR